MLLFMDSCLSEIPLFKSCSLAVSYLKSGEIAEVDDGYRRCEVAFRAQGYLRQVCVTLDGALITRLIAVLRQHIFNSQHIICFTILFFRPNLLFFPICATTAPLSRHHGQESYHLAKSGLKAALVNEQLATRPNFLFFSVQSSYFK